ARKPGEGGGVERAAGDGAGRRPPHRRHACRRGPLRARRRARARPRHQCPQGRETPGLRDGRAVTLTRTPLAPVSAAFATGLAISFLAAPMVFVAAWLVAAAACIACLAAGRIVPAA